jgi:hypothetical protein
MSDNNYMQVSEDLYEVLEQDDDIRHAYIDLLGLLRDLLAPFSSRFIEVVFSPQEIDRKIIQISELLKPSQPAASIGFANITLGRNLVKLATESDIDNFLAGIHSDFDRIRMIRSKSFDFDQMQ